MYCDGKQGYLTNVSNLTRWGIVDLDWNGMKEVWAKQHPMDCEEMMVNQAKIIKTASPKTSVWVYRNRRVGSQCSCAQIHIQIIVVRCGPNHQREGAAMAHDRTREA